MTGIKLLQPKTTMPLDVLRRVFFLCRIINIFASTIAIIHGASLQLQGHAGGSSGRIELQSQNQLQLALDRHVKMVADGLGRFRYGNCHTTCIHLWRALAGAGPRQGEPAETVRPYTNLSLTELQFLDLQNDAPFGVFGEEDSPRQHGTRKRTHTTSDTASHDEQEPSVSEIALSEAEKVALFSTPNWASSPAACTFPADSRTVPRPYTGVVTEGLGSSVRTNSASGAGARRPRARLLVLKFHQPDIYTEDPDGGWNTDRHPGFHSLAVVCVEAVAGDKEDGPRFLVLQSFRARYDLRQWLESDNSVVHDPTGLKGKFGGGRWVRRVDIQALFAEMRRWVREGFVEAAGPGGRSRRSPGGAGGEDIDKDSSASDEDDDEMSVPLPLPGCFGLLCRVPGGSIIGKKAFGVVGKRNWEKSGVATPIRLALRTWWADIRADIS